MAYKHNKNWRLRNPEKRYEGKARYYRKHKESPENSRNSRQEWILSEIKQITDPERPSDTILARKLGRSVSAVQAQRCQLRA